MAGSINLALSQQFDKLGAPLAGGKLSFIRAGTVSTPQNAFFDATLTLPLPNPFTLDDSGRIPFFFLADGSIKIVLIDQHGTTQLTADNIPVVGSSSGGGGGGTVDPTTVLQTGWLQPIYGTGVISGFVRCNARTIGSATSGATERANADTQSLFTFLYNGDPNLAVSTGRGSSAALDWAANKTIALPDFRGRALAALDDMGNSPANRLTATYFGTAATVLGAAGGAESRTLTLAQLPTGITATGTFALSLGNILNTLSNVLSLFSSTSGGNVFNAFASSTTSAVSSPTASGTVTSSNTGGAAHATASPMMLATIYLKL